MKPFPLALLAILFFSCKNHGSTPEKTIPGPKTDSVITAQDFFPVADFIGGQIKMIDSLQLPLSKSVTINNKTKLEAVTDQEFKSLALNFSQPDINAPGLKIKYKETSIADQSIPSVTLTYSTADTSLQVQKISVFIKPDPVANDKVNAIYIEKLFTKGDTIFNQKLYWKTGKNFQITTEKKTGGKLLPVEQVKVIWDPVE